MPRSVEIKPLFLRFATLSSFSGMGLGFNSPAVLSLLLFTFVKKKKDARLHVAFCVFSESVSQ